MIGHPLPRSGRRNYTVEMQVDLRPRPRWVRRWRPWSATITCGLGYLGDLSGPSRWRAKTRAELEALCRQWITQHALSHGERQPAIRIVDPLGRPLKELRDGLLAAAQRQTKENTMDAITMDDAIEQWAAHHGLTRDQADKLVSWDEEEGLRLRFRPHQWARVLGVDEVPADEQPKAEPTYPEIVADVIGETIDSTDRLRMLLEKADVIARDMVNTPYSLRPGYQKRLLACTSAARNLLYAIKVAGR